MGHHRRWGAVGGQKASPVVTVEQRLEWKPSVEVFHRMEVFLGRLGRIGPCKRNSRCEGLGMGVSLLGLRKLSKRTVVTGTE